ncbi:MAG: hypothetical protein GXY04_03560 [Acholeplasmataceae bacterium]|nr:hypothetical protein [Acholeplasmataceae bacterium]
MLSVSRLSHEEQLIPCKAQFDSEYNMPMTAQGVNVRSNKDKRIKSLKSMI